jgi:hypothetical protein
MVVFFFPLIDWLPAWNETMEIKGNIFEWIKSFAIMLIHLHITVLNVKLVHFYCRFLQAYFPAVLQLNSF